MGDYRVLFDLPGSTLLIQRILHRSKAMIDLMVHLHPQYIRSNGRDEFVVLPRDEFTALCELFEDIEDLRLIEEA